MAQKRRGLGRGLQALIPEAQKEKVPAASRPSDVFFPDSRKDESRDEDAASQATHDAPEPEPAAEARQCSRSGRYSPGSVSAEAWIQESLDSIHDRIQDRCSEQAEEAGFT